jgi:hypothetical protein
MAQGHADGPRRSAAEVEQDIGRTRAELGLTLDALQRKLTARHLLQKGIDMVTESIGDEGGVSISFEGFRADPIALALIGLGVAWLLVANTGVLDTMAQDERMRAARQRLTNLTGIGGGKSGAMPEAQGPAFVGSPTIGAAGRTGGWVHQAADAARGAIRAVRDTAGEYTGRPGGWLRGASRTALDRAGGYAGYAGDRAGDMGNRMTGTFVRHPLLIGVAGLFAGALLASILPPTRAEDGWFGESRDRALKRAGELGRETIQRVRRNIDRVSDEAAPGDATAL